MSALKYFLIYLKDSIMEYGWRLPVGWGAGNPTNAMNGLNYTISTVRV